MKLKSVEGNVENLSPCILLHDASLPSDFRFAPGCAISMTQDYSYIQDVDSMIVSVHMSFGSKRIAT